MQVLRLVGQTPFEFKTTSVSGGADCRKPWRRHYPLPAEVELFLLPRSAGADFRHGALDEIFFYSPHWDRPCFYENIPDCLFGHNRLPTGSWLSEKLLCSSSSWMVATNWLLTQIPSRLPAAVNLRCCTLCMPIPSQPLRFLSNLHKNPRAKLPLTLLSHDTAGFRKHSENRLPEDNSPHLF